MSEKKPSSSSSISDSILDHLNSEEGFLKSLLQDLSGAQKVALIAHRSPDGDAVGSVLGFSRVLQQQFPSLSLDHICCDPLPRDLLFLHGSHTFQASLRPHEYDLIIFLDVAIERQTGLEESTPSLFSSGRPPTYVIDHHISNSLFGDQNLVVPSAASTTSLLWEITKHYGWKVDPIAATALLTGLLTDTGGLQHSNADSQALRASAELIRLGAQNKTIQSELFQKKSLSTLRLWGAIWKRIHRTPENVIMSYVTEADVKRVGANNSDISGAIDYMNMIPAAYSLLLSERGNTVKGSIRTQQPHIDVNEVAKKVGGGGHPKAAGFTLPGKLAWDHRYRISQVVS